MAIINRFLMKKLNNSPLNISIKIAMKIDSIIEIITEINMFNKKIKYHKMPPLNK